MLRRVVSVRDPACWTRSRRATDLALAVTVLAALPARGAVYLIQADLQLLNDVSQLSQAGWNVAEIAKDTGSVTSVTVPVTAAGTSAGISAALVSGQKWESRGGPAVEHRSIISGTSYNGVLSDFWFSRVLTATLRLTGLATDGTTYLLTTWHNDSYTPNQGFAWGGGSVSATISGGTILSSTTGLVTNLQGAQTDGAFTPTTVSFTASAATTDLVFTRSGGTITSILFNGFELSLGGGGFGVAEGASAALVPLGVAGACWAARRRPRAPRRE